MKLSDISVCSDSCAVGFYQWLLRCMSANANLSMDMRWAELAELAELGAEKDKGHKDMWRISRDQEIDRTSLQSFYVRRWRKWRTLPMWGHRGGLSLDLNSMGLAYLGLTYIPKSPCPQEDEKDCSFDGWLDRKENCFQHRHSRHRQRRNQEISQRHFTIITIIIIFWLPIITVFFVECNNNSRAVPWKATRSHGQRCLCLAP